MTNLSSLFARYGFRFADEADLQESLARVLSENGIKFAREVALGDAGRIDFMVDGRIGLEVKTGGSAPAVVRQLWRYAGRDEIDGLLLVTTKRQHVAALPAEMLGKPVQAVVVRAQ